MTCTESFNETRSQYDGRVDSLLRDMVVEEALGALEGDRNPKSFTLMEISDYLGIGFESVRRVEREAMSNFKKLMLESEQDDE
jgi:DNA-directed RNA polymerase sigma subunit (sigma70/sigma32)